MRYFLSFVAYGQKATTSWAGKNLLYRDYSTTEAVVGNVLGDHPNLSARASLKAPLWRQSLNSWMCSDVSQLVDTLSLVLGLGEKKTGLHKSFNMENFINGVHFHEFHRKQPALALARCVPSEDWQLL